jgi:hypothetical protein
MDAFRPETDLLVYYTLVIARTHCTDADKEIT